MITIKVKRDTDAQSPRENDNLGVMATWHRGYRLGDVQPKCDPQEWHDDADNVPEGSVVLPLYLMDHGGISMSTGDYGDRWDSGRVGWIVATPDKIREDQCLTADDEITAEIRASVERTLKSEVSVYSDYLEGNVWGYTIERWHKCSECGSKVHDDDATFNDSCWGFIGSDKSTLDAMKEHVDAKEHAALEAAWEVRS